MPNYKDISKEIRITPHLCNGSGAKAKGLQEHWRLTMYYDGKPIGVWKSKGWDLGPNYEIRHTPHPEHPSDDSWFTVWKKQEVEQLNSMEALTLKQIITHPKDKLSAEGKLYLEEAIRKLDTII